MCSERNVMLYSVRQHNEFIIKGNTRLHVSTITPMLTFVLPDAVHTFRSHRVYIRGIYLIKTFV